MKKTLYPGIFHREGDQYWVEFPDLPGCHSFADTLPEIYEYAKESLTGYCMALIEEGDELPSPSDIYEIKPSADTFVSLVEADLVKTH